MAEVSAIEWTDATVNFWWGCKKVGPGCDHCYAETWAQRFGIPDYDESGVRRRIKGAIALIRKLQRGADKFEAEHGRRRRVFIQSMSDFFDNAVNPEWRDDAWNEICNADRLDIQLVTKRIPNVQKMIGGRWPAHVGLIATIVNQEEADRDIWRLLTLKKNFGIPWVGLSIEPMLGQIDLWSVKIPGSDHRTLQAVNGLDSKGVAQFEGGIDWVIVGGESGRDARPINPNWVRAIRDACDAVDVPFLWKQWGEWAHADIAPSGTPGRYAIASRPSAGGGQFSHAVVVEVDQYPRQMSLYGGASVMERVGKKTAGRLLDGRTHDGFPRLHA